VYLSGRDAAAHGAAPTRAVWRRVDRNVAFLGLTSMFTDVSSEMITAVAPIYLTTVLGLTALQFGLVDGLYQGVTALLRTASGLVADRRGRHKEAAFAGYALAAVCKLVLFVAPGAPVPVVGSLLLDRVGKGIRAVPRDALITLSSRRAHLGEAFGVHRALDTAGALLGPIVAFVLLAAVPGRYDAVFLTSFCAAVLGLSILVLFVENRAADGDMPGSPRPVSLRSALGLLRQPEFRILVVAGTTLALVTIGDAFVYLVLQRRANLDARFFPLLYVGTAFVFLTLAIPAGRLADRYGRQRMFLAGYVLLLAAYLVLLLPAPGLVAVSACLLLLGAYYAATDGVLMALAGATLPSSYVGSGIALLTTAIALARLAAAVVFGALWSWGGPEPAVLAFGLALALTILGTAAAVRGRAGRTAP
jgi:MFS family permease